MDWSLLWQVFVGILAFAYFIYVGGIWLSSSFILVYSLFSNENDKLLPLIKNDWMWSSCLIVAVLLPMDTVFRIAVVIAASFAHTTVKNNYKS
jgi:hypothetical protein